MQLGDSMEQLQSPTQVTTHSLVLPSKALCLNLITLPHVEVLLILTQLYLLDHFTVDDPL